MSLSFKRTYKFAFKSALYITLFGVGFVGILSHYIFHPNQEHLTIFLIVFAFLSFFFFSYPISGGIFHLPTSEKDLRRRFFFRI